MLEFDKQECCGITIQQIPFEQIKEIVQYQKESNEQYMLYWAEENKDIQIVFCSHSKEIQALEFMDFLVQDYAIVQGDAFVAHTIIVAAFLQSMMLDLEIESVEQLLMKLVERYFEECRCVEPKIFIEKNREAILEIPKYVKRNTAWAYVKVTDVMNIGDKFYLKSLENQSRILLEATEDLYIMIGCRGEIYHIDRKKFEKIYEPSEEQLDIFEQMLSFLPEIELCGSGEFVALDEMAHLCYPKTFKGIYAVELEYRTKVFNPYNNGEYFLGRKGDYLVICCDDLLDIYIIQKNIFNESYKAVL